MEQNNLDIRQNTTRFCNFCRRDDLKCIYQKQDPKDTDICFECVLKAYNLVKREIL